MSRSRERRLGDYPRQSVARTLLVRRLRISARTAQKLREEHELEPDDVRAKIENVGNLPFSWDVDPNRGLRAYVYTAIGDEPVLVVLYPAIDEGADVWNLGSAYRV
jgi:hypothetical protein